MSLGGKRKGSSMWGGVGVWVAGAIWGSQRWMQMHPRKAHGCVWCPGVDVTRDARAGEGVCGVREHTDVVLGTKPCASSRTRCSHLSLLLPSRSAMLRLYDYVCD